MSEQEDLVIIRVRGYWFSQEHDLIRRMGSVDMHDADVRAATWNVIKRRKDSQNAVLLNEFGLCGEVRADIAVINGHMTGFELKSASDTLTRLPKQVEYYSKVMDYCNLVVAENHREAAESILPDFWGEYLACTGKAGQTYIRKMRPAKINRCVDPESIVQLLWKPEAEFLLRKYDLYRGLSGKSRFVWWDRLATSLNQTVLRQEIRLIIKSRTNWRDDLVNPIR